MKEKILFMKQFFKRPVTTGAIAPSSRSLAKEIVRQAGVNQANVVLEFGPGTGAFTGHILNSKKKDAHFVAIERNAALVKILQTKFPDLHIEKDCIENVENILESKGINSKADSIVCGLPWASFDGKLQNKLLDATHRVLKPGGIFTTFAYLQGLMMPAGQKFKENIYSRFDKVEKSRVVWNNLPPAFVYRCQRN